MIFCTQHRDVLYKREIEAMLKAMAEKKELDWPPPKEPMLYNELKITPELADKREQIEEALLAGIVAEINDIVTANPNKFVEIVNLNFDLDFRKAERCLVLGCQAEYTIR